MSARDSKTRESAEVVEVLDYKPPVGRCRRVWPFRREESPPRKKYVVGVDRLR